MRHGERAARVKRGQFQLQSSGRSNRRAAGTRSARGLATPQGAGQAFNGNAQDKAGYAGSFAEPTAFKVNAVAGNSRGAEGADGLLGNQGTRSWTGGFMGREAAWRTRAPS